MVTQAKPKFGAGHVVTVSKGFEAFIREHGEGEVLDQLMALRKEYRAEQARRSSQTDYAARPKSELAALQKKYAERLRLIEEALR